MENTNPTPQSSTSLDSAQCPSCGFFVGPMLTCPRCGARAQKRIAVRAVRIFCIIGSIVGVIALWVASYYKTPEEMHVKDITELTINAMATIKGTVTMVRENPVKKSLTIAIDDGTAPPINMLAFGKLDEMRRLGRVPRVGDKVEVTGNISVSQTYGVTIMLAVPERLVIVEPVKPVSIASLSVDDVDKTVLIRVTREEYVEMPTRSGSVLHRFKVSDNSGSIGLVMFDGTFKKMTDETRALLTESSREFEVFVKLGEYQGEVNGTISDINSITPVDGSATGGSAAPAARPSAARPAGPVGIGDLTDNDVDKTVTLSVKVESYATRATRSGSTLHMFTVSDNTGTFELVMFDSNFQQLPESTRTLLTTTGQAFTAAVKVGSYQGKLNGAMNDIASIKPAGSSAGSAD